MSLLVVVLVVVALAALAIKFIPSLRSKVVAKEASLKGDVKKAEGEVKSEVDSKL